MKTGSDSQRNQLTALRHRQWNCLHKSLPSLLCAVSGRPAHFLGPAKRGKPGTHVHDKLTQTKSSELHVSSREGAGIPLWRGLENTGPKVGTQQRWQTPKIHRLRRRPQLTYWPLRTAERCMAISPSLPGSLCSQ
jgi:hypothetical protein